MFEIVTTLLNQLIGILPELIAFYIVFDLLGSLLFSKR